MAEIGKLEILSQAKIDFYSQIEYLAKKDCPVETLYKFIDEMEAAAQSIARSPTTWPLARPSQRVRKFGPTKSFRYVIFYVILKDGTIRVIEYLGPGRQPRWTGRL